jgi:hypothetical protein
MWTINKKRPDMGKTRENREIQDAKYQAGTFLFEKERAKEI